MNHFADVVLSVLAERRESANRAVATHLKNLRSPFSFADQPTDFNSSGVNQTSPRPAQRLVARTTSEPIPVATRTTLSTDNSLSWGDLMLRAEAEAKCGEASPVTSQWRARGLEEQRSDIISRSSFVISLSWICRSSDDSGLV